MLNTSGLIKCVSMVCMTVLLSCCNQSSNPLQAMSKNQSGRLLAQASSQAERSLHHRGDGYDYGDCMQSRKAQSYCEALYGTMIVNLRHDKMLSHLSIAQLSDVAAFKRNKAAYLKSVYELV